MIRINDEIQTRMNDFLDWIQSELRIKQDKKGNIGIEALTGKTSIMNYLGDYQQGEDHLSSEEFWKIIQKNTARIQANLKSKSLMDAIVAQYETSLSILLPIKEKLSETDRLIDQIVYRLYGLTEEDIAIVEGS